MFNFRQFFDSFRIYLDRRVLQVFVLGMASGFPWVMIGSVLNLWLQEEGLSRSKIGFAGLIFSVYAVNFLWAPLIDRLLNRKIWLLISQVSIAVFCIFAASCNPVDSLEYLIFACLLIATSSATQDIVIASVRINLFSESENDQLTAASAAETAGWWTGYAGIGFIPLWLSDQSSVTWPQIYLILAGLMFCFLINSLFIKITSIKQERIKNQSYLSYFVDTFYNPIKEFFTRNGLRLACLILAFIFLFKIGEAFLGRMSIVFYKEIGFSNTDIGIYSKLISWWVTIVFSLIGGAFSIKLGIVRGLLIGGIAMAASNLMFSLMALIGPNKLLFAATIIVDGFTSAWSTVAFVAFISLLCNRTFSATQYALFASLGTLGRTVLSSSSGVMVDYLDGNWALFFAITAVMVMPALLLLMKIKPAIEKIENS